jgi:methylmalonyl-CoA mutase N-terminal domain/subunit
VIDVPDGEVVTKRGAQLVEQDQRRQRIGAAAARDQHLIAATPQVVRPDGTPHCVECPAQAAAQCGSLDITIGHGSKNLSARPRQRLASLRAGGPAAYSLDGPRETPRCGTALPLEHVMAHDAPVAVPPPLPEDCRSDAAARPWPAVGNGTHGQPLSQVPGDADPRLIAYRKAAATAAERAPSFLSLDGRPIEACYLPSDADAAYFERIGVPGQYPFTRGVHANMYRGKPWTMRMFAGFGSPEDTNRRFKYLLAHGQTGLSTAFDMPTLMGYDPDHALSQGEVGREGVSVAHLGDMETLFADIPLGEITTSMTVNAPAVVLLALYVAVAERRGVPYDRVAGTLQNDILKEFIAQKEWICPPRPSMRIIRDMLGFCTDKLPRWNTISISGYHIREAGATAVQELAFTLADGLGYVDAGLEAGLDVDAFAPRLSFFFDVHNDFFEEIAKLRAARRLWARLMKERYAAKNPRSWMLRTHCQTAGVSLTAQQPMNNVVRTTWQALAAVLGGAQSLHTNSLDETYALPTEEAAKLALRTQQLLLDESGVANTADPLGGSWFIEHLTDRVEAEALAIIQKIDDIGGIVRAIEVGYPQREIAESAFRFQQRVETGERKIVGVNSQTEGEQAAIPLLHIDPEVERSQLARCKAWKAARSQAAAQRAIGEVERACSGRDNLVPPILAAVHAGVTLGEISDVFRRVFGVYRDPAFL